MSTVGQPRPHYTLVEYLDVEEQSPAVKHEYVAGEIFAMAGGSVEHAGLAMAIGIELGAQLRAGCRAYSSDLRIWIDAAEMATYADVAVVCEPIARHPRSPTHVTNPAVIVEVLSPSTEAYDREGKRLAYQQLASLVAYVIVAQDRRRIELWQRAGADWHHTVHDAGSVAVIAPLELALDIDAIYTRAGVAP